MTNGAGQAPAAGPAAVVPDPNANQFADLGGDVSLILKTLSFLLLILCSSQAVWTLVLWTLLTSWNNSTLTLF
jgi:hypothetical protein